MTDVSEPVAKLPYLRFRCGYDACSDDWLVAVYWRPNPNPQPGQLCYLRGFELHGFRNPFWYVRIKERGF